MTNKERRQYTHNCPREDGKEVILRKETCPKCGQAGRLDGWYIGMYEAMGRFRRLYGVPPTGIQLRFLPQMGRTCGLCGGERYIEGQDGEDDAECPACQGAGSTLTRSREEMEKIRRWALARFERAKNEDESEWEKKEIPEELILTRDEDYLIQAFGAIMDDEEENGERNERIGELMLQANGDSWDFLMELIEKWELLGGGLRVRGSRIYLCAAGKGRPALAALEPGGANGEGLMRLRRRGSEASVKGLGLDEARAILRAMREVGGM